MTVMISPGLIRLIVASSDREMAVEVQAFALGRNGRVASNTDMLFKGNLNGMAGRGKMRAPHVIDLDLNGMAQDVTSIIFSATTRTATQSDKAIIGISLQNKDGKHLERLSVPAEGTFTIGSLRRWRDGWRFDAHAGPKVQSLTDIAISMGVDVRNREDDEDTPPEQRVARQKRRRTEAMMARDPDLAESATVALTTMEKQFAIETSARVALVLDISVSMFPHFENGSIDDLIRNILAFSFQIDDDGTIDVFLFGQHAYPYGKIDERNYHSFGHEIRRDHALETNTMYGQAIQEVLKHYEATPSEDPVLVLFVTDGDTNDKDLTEKLLRNSSSQAFFWQFVAIGKKPATLKEGRWLPSGFTFLEHLDELKGRVVDNVAFHSVENPAISDLRTFYDIILGEYLTWLDAARSSKLISR